MGVLVVGWNAPTLRGIGGEARLRLGWEDQRPGNLSSRRKDVALAGQDGRQVSIPFILLIIL